VIASVFGVVLPWAIVAVGCWIGLQLIRQNGRLLLRVEALEARFGSFEEQLGQVLRMAGVGQQAMGGMASAGPQGLAVGTDAPDFELPTLHSGERVSLSQYRGRRVLLTFFSPNCGYCVQMAPDLAALSLEDPTPIVLTSGSPDENRRFFEEHGIKCPVLLQTAGEVAQQYQATGTPMGYLIDADGKIASPLAAGAQAVLAVARQAPTLRVNGSVNGSRNGGKGLSGARPLSESHILRTGLPIGTVAPSFTLPHVDGGELSLDEYRGRRVVLVLSDPSCGPCTALAPQLEAAHRESSEPAVVLVSRGALEENRRKVAEYGLTFPVVVQRQWEVSRAYGIFATPVGFLIDERGIITAEVAQGPQEILALCARARNLQPEEGVHAVS
jgi:methylamine dehydrogenase accessory protein MauD